MNDFLRNGQARCVPQRRQRILLLTSRTGGGHVSLAEALRDHLEGEFDCTIVDPQPSLFHAHYRLVSRHALWLWQAEYGYSNQPARAQTAHRVFAELLARPMQRLLATVQPDLILSTYSMWTEVMHRAVRDSGRDIPTAMLLADPQNVHATWLAIKAVDNILAPTRETEQQALAAGFSHAQVHLSGWPVRRQFYVSSDKGAVSRTETVHQARDAALHALGLEAGRFTVLLQGGGEGTARFSQTVEAVLGANAHDPAHAVQIILATGTNEALRTRFADTPRVYALPFTQEIARYMQISDVIMGKAGPNMLFESVALGKPFIATTYIRGQETPNLEFIQRHNLGWVALTAGEQRSLIEALVRDPAKLTAQAAAVARYGAWNQACLTTLLPRIRGLLDQKVSAPMGMP